MFNARSNSTRASYDPARAQPVEEIVGLVVDHERTHDPAADHAIEVAGPRRGRARQQPGVTGSSTYMSPESDSADEAPGPADRRQAAAWHARSSRTSCANDQPQERSSHWAD